ncbi:cytochrome c oxidase subunit 3 [Undibacterium sp. Jales W-56]|uniref:cytochrome c oxidase subunit 3 n=1 Tax=Undibacterium sp. Jales W-56 TaxID=2897325 RepID=UPI0021D0AA2E|nr:cytochrome c oxidase subunit 3 [Undibacterium sp. Jales W-56]MCU6434486.1 cytochrome c oxidase subunit 3 [Undibacterium sp. Jales W-56]
MSNAAFSPPQAKMAAYPDKRAELSVALWVFIGVATTLFLLFLAAYVMRMNGADWSVIQMPWQLGLSTFFLCSASLALQVASKLAHSPLADPASGAWRQGSRPFLLLGGVCSIGFLASQISAWQALAAMQVALAGNPSGSFFYLLTAMHGLHVLGGLVIYAITLRQVWIASDPGRLAWQIALCARYWHFLLAVWLLLFATLNWLTPELVQAICGPR